MTKILWLVAVLAFALVAEVAAAPIESDRIRVIDGDTIRVDRAQPDVRLVPFNTPETRRPACAQESELGGRATRRLRDMVRAGGLDLQVVPCACRPGTEGTMACNHGRRCGVLKSNGRNVGDILTAEGLAVPYHCSETHCSKLVRPWCGQQS